VRRNWRIAKEAIPVKEADFAALMDPDERGQAAKELAWLKGIAAWEVATPARAPRTPIFITPELANAVVTIKPPLALTSRKMARDVAEIYAIHRFARLRRPGKPANMNFPRAKTAGFCGVCTATGFSRSEERDSGVYITCESITLTRDIPSRQFPRMPFGAKLSGITPKVDRFRMPR
jgi:hypothetical protein